MSAQRFGAVDMALEHHQEASDQYEQNHSMSDAAITLLLVADLLQRLQRLDAASAAAERARTLALRCHHGWALQRAEEVLRSLPEPDEAGLSPQ